MVLDLEYEFRSPSSLRGVSDFLGENDQCVYAIFRAVLINIYIYGVKKPCFYGINSDGVRRLLPIASDQSVGELRHHYIYSLKSGC